MTAFAEQIPSESEVQECLLKIIANKDKEACRDAYIYAVGARTLSGLKLQIQVHYVLAHVKYWRGPTAKRCKGILEAYARGPIFK
jgi:hypothetical protein